MSVKKRPGSLKKYLTRSVRPHEAAFVSRAELIAIELARLTHSDVRIQLDNQRKTAGWILYARIGDDNNVTVTTERFIHTWYSTQLGLE